MRPMYVLVITVIGSSSCLVGADPVVDKRNPLFAYLTSTPSPALIAYTPSQLDPRQEANHQKLPTSSIRADLTALRPTFDGLILYGYHEASTPRVLAVAKSLKYRAVLLGIWDPKSAKEIDGVIKLVQQYHKVMALGVIVGNEGITFKRYETEDLTIAAGRLRSRIPNTVPLTTSEPLVGYKVEAVKQFGNFLAPNVHPVFDQPQLNASQSALWARKQTARLAQEVDKPALLKETGFPHGGTRGQKRFDPEAQAAFWDAYLKAGLLEYPQKSRKGWVFYGVAFEAFDLPWKASASGLSIEKSWGLFSDKRAPYPALKSWRTVQQKK